MANVYNKHNVTLSCGNCLLVEQYLRELEAVS